MALNNELPYPPGTSGLLLLNLIKFQLSDAVIHLSRYLDIHFLDEFMDEFAGSFGYVLGSQPPGDAFPFGMGTSYSADASMAGTR